MQLDSVIKKKNLEKVQWVKVASFPYAITKPSARFFYIGKEDTTIQALSNCFQSGAIVESFDQAQTLLASVKETAANSFDVIFIDVPLVKTELEGFCTFLKAHALFGNTPIIYSEGKLNFAHVKQLRQLKLIDDVMDITNSTLNYTSKLAFLKKMKAQAAGEKKDSTAQQPKPKGYYFKRAFDITLALVCLVLLSPLFVLIALIIKCESKGPVFYNSLRAGKGFKVFKFYKFRTMEVNADKKIEALAHLNQYNSDTHNGPLFFKLNNDPRITRFGKILRNTSLDELPQLFNVLKGDMSLVGNRPLPLYEAATLTTNEFVERFMAPAGITGLWQIKKRGKADMSTEERISLDISYARKASLLYDLQIMASTPKALFQKSNV